MRFNTLPINDAQRYAYKVMADPKSLGLPELFKVPKDNITVPGVLVQELPFINTQNTYEFQFATGAPLLTLGTFPQLNNVVLGENDVFVQYAIQFLIGVPSSGSPAGNLAGRVYSTRGFQPGDFSIYNAQVSIQLETNTPVQKIQALDFLETSQFGIPYDMQQQQGVLIINPVRIVTGRLSNYKVTFKIPAPINTLTLSANSVLSCRLHGALGLAPGR